MRDYKCTFCNEIITILLDEEELNHCPSCGSKMIKRLWPTAINMNGHGWKNNFQGEKDAKIHNKT